MTIANQIADWAAGLQWHDVPGPVQERVLSHIADSIGLAFASVGSDYADATIAGLAEFGAGDSVVIGHQGRLARRDAAIANGVLIHGLDYDDTHLIGVVHTSASALPLALAEAAHRRLPGADLLLGYLIALEVTSRIGAAANGGFHARGFHPTGVAGAFGAATAAARLAGGDAAVIARAQGFAGSIASGSLEFLATGASTKRLHPGWAAACGMTAAAFAGHGFTAPPEVYEGRFGLYNTHTPPGHELDLELATAGLGQTWEMLRVAVKPYPVCHFAHACADAAAALRSAHDLAPDDIESILCRVPEAIVPIVCEPAADKLRPPSDYEAKFSLPFIVGTVLAQGRFTLAELQEPLRSDPVSLALAAKVSYEVDPDSTFPEHFTGEVVITTRDGRTVGHREDTNRGSGDRPLSVADIDTKYADNMAGATTPEHAARIHAALQALPEAPDSADFAALLAQHPDTPNTSEEEL